MEVIKIALQPAANTDRVATVAQKDDNHKDGD